MKGVYVVSIARIAILFVLAVSFPSPGHADDKGKAKSELMALVGLRVPPEVVGKQQGNVPNWHHLGGSMLFPKVYFENGYIGNEGGIMLVQVEEDMTRNIIDARALPKGLLRYTLRNGKFAWHKDAVKRYSVERCDKAGTDEVIVGLMRTERGKESCLHYSSDVRMAWRVNEEALKLEEVSTEGVSCFFPDAEDECIN